MSIYTSIIAACCAALIGAASPAIAAEKIRFANTDTEGLEELNRTYGEFRKTLSELIGVEVEFFPVNSRNVAAEALRNDQVDFVMAGPSEYVAFSSRSKVVPVVSMDRYDYFSTIVVRADSDIRSVSDLKGRKIAFGSVGSTSEHLAPALFLAQNGLKYGTDYQSLHIGREQYWEALKRGDVDAIGTSNRHFVRMRGEEKELPPQAFRVIARTPDLSNDVLVASPFVKKELIQKVQEAFTDPEKSKAIKAALMSTQEGKEKFSIYTFGKSVKDSDFDVMRDAYIAIGQPALAKRAQ